MGRAVASQLVPGPLAEVEALWYEPARWPSWIDGFAHVASISGGWPERGGALDWDSRPGGRGRVRERVTAFELRAGQTAEVEDEQLSGTQSVAFSAEGDRVRITLSLEYRLKERNPLTALVDLLFIRRALAASLQRSLARFARERAADADFPA